MGIQADGAAPLKGKKVLIADRHKHTRAALRDTVTSLGALSVVHVQSAGEVLRCVKAREVNIILCDYLLEDIRDGQQLLEELRHDHLIPLATIFMMITGERNYRKVISVAEFAPDDYLVKPFNANQLLDRIIKVSRKKDVFARAFAFMESGRPEAALPECRSVASGYPEYAADAYRLMIDMLLGMKRFPEAESLIKLILERKPVPWAFMGLARIHHAEGRFGEAEGVLEKLTASNPEYLGAQDLLARVKAELDRPDEALKVLETATTLSSGNVLRLRRTAELAAVTGDHDKSARLYGLVLERARNSSLARAEDYIALSDAFMAQGKLADVERVCSEQKRNMRGVPEADLVSQFMAHRRFSHMPGDEAQKAASEAVDSAITARRSLTAELSAALEFDLFNACLLAGREDAGIPLGRNLLARNDLSRKIRTRVESELASRASAVTRSAAIVSLDQVIAMLGKLAAQGWNDALAAACDASILHWSQKAPEDPRLGLARDRMKDVLRKFGISAQAGAREQANA
jgi:CheY-like chemotaxis protein